MRRLPAKAEMCLEHGETWEEPFAFEVTEAGEDRKMEFAVQGS